MRRPIYETRNVQEWNENLEQFITHNMYSLKVWKSSAKVISAFTVGSPFAINQGDVGLIMKQTQKWFQEALNHCAEMINHPASRFTNFFISVVADAKSIDFYPTLSYDAMGAVEGHTDASCIIARPTKIAYLQFATNEEGWQKWKAEEQRLATTSLEELIASGEVEEQEQQSFYETQGHPGRIYLKVTKG